MNTNSNISRRFVVRLAASFIMGVSIFCLPGTSAAQPEQNEQAATETGIEFQPRLGEYHYEIIWGHNKIGKGVISIERDAEHYVLRASKETTGLVNKIYRLRYTGEARIKTESLSPVDSIIVEENRKRTKVQIAQYPASEETDTVKVIETRSQNKQEEVETKEYEFVSDTGVMDIFSAIFLARNFDWQIGERHEFIIFVGSKQYEVKMDCIGETTFTIGDETIPVWVIQPTSRKMADDNSTFSHEDTFVYLSADESKDIIKIKSKLGIGSVKLRLVNYLEQ